MKCIVKTKGNSCLKRMECLPYYLGLNGKIANKGTQSKYMRYFQCRNNYSKMICRMCLMDSPEGLDIFVGAKTAYDIASTIAQHFWFEPKYDDQMSNTVCAACWRQIESFHEYYLGVEKAQRNLSEGLAVKPERQEPASTGQPMVNISQQFLKLEPEQSYGVNNASLEGGGNKIELIEYAIEQKLEQDYSLNYKTNLYNYFIESTKPEGVYEDLIEEVKASLYDDIPEQTVTSRNPEAQTNIEDLINGGSVDSDSTEHIESVDYDSEDAPLASLRLPQTDICSTDQANYDSDDAPLASLRLRQTEISSTPQTSKRRKRSRHSLSKYEDDLKIARRIELKCDLCDEDFATFAEISRHISKAHGRRGYVKCCDRKLFTKAAVMGHLNEHFVYVKGSKCNRTYPSKRSLKRHLSPLEVEKKAPKVYSCVNCSERFHRQDLRDEHNCLISESCFSCDICSKLFLSETVLEMHRRSMHEPKQCPTCAKVMEGETQLAEHQLEHSDIVDQKIQCEKCGMWLKSLLHLKAHTKKAHRDGKSMKKKEFTCKICGRMSSSNEGLKSHMKYMHRAQRKFECSVCGKGFKKRLYLKEHMAGHTGQPLYTCPHCPRSFKSSGNMHGHRKRAHRQEWEEGRRIRALEKPKTSEPICKICGKKSISNVQLRAHMSNVHTAQRKFACSVCGKGFKRRPHLKEHMAAHTGEPLYTCPCCPQTFINSGNMYVHRKTVHGQ